MNEATKAPPARTVNLRYFNAEMHKLILGRLYSRVLFPMIIAPIMLKNNAT